MLSIRREKTGWPAVLAVALMAMAAGGAAYAQDAATVTNAVADATNTVVQAAAEVTSNVKAEKSGVDLVWTIVCAFLVFFMQAGFALVETGLTRAKNACNIIMKNLLDFAMASVAFFVLGFGLMFGDSNGFFGSTLFGLSGVGGNDWGYTFFLFQLVFAGTTATIVSGAMAERTKFSAYLVYSGIVSLVVYPIFGHWAWGNLLDGDTDNGVWLAAKGFTDFAGSTVVHSIGGWLALAGAIVLGPRLGKYGPDGKPRAILGHNLPMAALGVFILWLGWFGFNPGSTNVADGSIGRIAVTTNFAAATGAIGALITAWLLLKKPEITMSLNGALAGLVAITAGCYTVTPVGAALIGLMAGILVVLAVLFFDRVAKIDDPVGAISVHGVCGAFGTLMCGFFNAEGVIDAAKTSTGLLYGGGTAQLVTQLIGMATAFAWAFGCGMILFLGIKYTMGLRVSEEEELRGLDIDEHGNEAYAGFQIFSNQ